MQQREQNPDVNSRQPAANPAEDAGISNDPRNDIERGRDDDVIPVPPDVKPTVPIEEPPGSDGPPVGDVDDSPKQIAG
ncbi:MAG TPA: hypothetical protein VJV05_12160 [Pyrinomonadaceae bacterium]|nr:hypothetical protein [Pyrinomonadaceae bacterium]